MMLAMTSMPPSLTSASAIAVRSTESSSASPWSEKALPPSASICATILSAR